MQIRCVKPFGEPAIHVTQQPPCVVLLALGLPESSAAHGGTKFQRFGVLAAGQDMTDQKAQELLDQFVAVDDEALKVRRAHVKKFLEVLPAKRVARYFQVENKLNAIVNYDLARGIPLIK